HSGSRGLGQSILDAHIQQHGDKGLIEGTPECSAYLSHHNNAQEWARQNREIICRRVLEALSASSAESAAKIVDIWHNNAEKKVFADGYARWVHRKGAAPSDRGPVVIPGSRGARSYLVVPTGDQERNAYSLAHGAGRRLPRAKARSRFGEQYKGANGMESLRTTALGSAVVCDDKDLLFEEAPDAYKGIEDVIYDLREVAKVVAILRPVVTYKLGRLE
ncbi:hypothetical protein HK104_007689, partial [Borealophlyctis nickersoniae]